MLRESIQRWVGLTISGTVTIRLRRGEDWTILDTVSPNLSYGPEKLSMERVGDAAFGPVDRIGQLTMRNLDIADSRSRLEQYAHLGLVGGATGELVGKVTAGGAAEIAASDTVDEELAEAVDAASEGAAFDSGTD
jgi:argininosuccinate synthase